MTLPLVPSYSASNGKANSAYHCPTHICDAIRARTTESRVPGRVNDAAPFGSGASLSASVSEASVGVDEGSEEDVVLVLSVALAEELVEVPEVVLDAVGEVEAAVSDELDEDSVGVAEGEAEEDEESVAEAVGRPEAVPVVPSTEN